MRRLCYFILTASLFVPFLGCKDNDESDDAAITITKIAYIFENINPGFWTSTPPATSFGYFGISYTGDAIRAEDIEYARIYRGYSASGNYWSFNVSAANVDTTNRKIGTSSGRFYTTNVMSDGSVFPIGPLLFIVKLKNGHSTSYNFYAPPPSSTTVNETIKYVYAPEVRSSYSEGTANVAQATILSEVKNVGQIDISFKVTDPKVYSGYLWFYDSSNNYVGRSKFFRDYETKAVTSIINGGGVFSNDGTANDVTITPSDLVASGTYGFADIAKFAIVLTDGLQYAEKASSSYDYRSISALTAF